ncbi:hypothetical protein GF366_02215 [Candidatus Peregrinibacteria bacterium]|nr:hypothetical protein [Candidatus Peregrinibacteria bacterium]
MKKILLFAVTIILLAGCCKTDVDSTIKVTNPLPNSEVTSPIELKGEAVGSWFFEGSFQVFLVDMNRNKISDSFATAQDEWMTEDFVPFKSEVPFEIKEDTVYAKLILEYENPSGIPEHAKMLEIPVILKDQKQETETTNFNVFFPNTEMNPEMLDCSNVYPVERTLPQTTAVAQTALIELLKGPTEEEIKEGYITSINDNVELNSVSIDDGTAYADFDLTLQYQVGGSCRVQSINSQIKQTLLQFPTIDNVVISVDGETEDVLEP